MDLLAEAVRHGIDIEYVDAGGRLRKVSPEVLERVLRTVRMAAVHGIAPDARVGPLPRRRAYQGGAGRWWVLSVQLYGIRSRSNWGHGDYSDLLSLIELAGQCGAAGIGVNPLHAQFDDRPEEPSPYSPNSRLFLNPLYIDVAAVEDFIDAEVLASDIARSRSATAIDYVGVTRLKQRGLRLAYQSFRRTADPTRRADFEAFRQARNPMLVRFASFEVLRRRLAGPWWEWPAKWRTPDDASLRKLRAEAEEDVEFHEYVQWVAHRQLMRCCARAGDLRLPVGLYLDVAVGVRADGFDAWNDPVAVLRDLSIGAPPDPLNTAGQNWGLAGFSGSGLQACAFKPFRDMLRASMRYAGAIRIDHVLGLKRLYLIPHGMPADQGAYMRLPFESLLRITADESRDNQCIVIGEDLGTVPENFREQLARWGLWSYRVTLFERGADGAFLSPAQFAKRALVTFATHDLPTFAGWRSGHDLRVKHAIGIDPGETDEERDAAIAQLRRALAAQDIANFDFPSVVRFLAAAPAKMLVVALEDVLGVEDQPNVPGTVSEHPNWRRKYPVELENLRESGVLTDVACAAAESGRGRRGRSASRRGRSAVAL